MLLRYTIIGIFTISIHKDLSYIDREYHTEYARWMLHGSGRLDIQEIVEWCPEPGSNRHGVSTEGF